jgi:hypothetical protein
VCCQTTIIYGARWGHLTKRKFYIGLQRVDVIFAIVIRIPVGVTLPSEVLARDVIASLIRMGGGNFRLLTRLLTHIERILKVNQLDKVSKEIVTAARDSLVIGQG